MNIAICDDAQENLDTACALLTTYSEKHNDIGYTIQAFLHPFDLLEKVENGTHYDIYLLDIYMTGMSGIALAQELRQRGIESPIIFFTVSLEHALEAFGVGATQYLVKPFTYEAFASAMGEAITRVGKMRLQQVLIKEGREYVHVNIQNIIYAETYDKVQILTLVDKQSLSPRMTSAALFGLLSQFPHFARCGSALILNLAHIRKLNAKSVLLSDGRHISIPRGAYQGLKEAYFAFFYERTVV